MKMNENEMRTLKIKINGCSSNIHLKLDNYAFTVTHMYIERNRSHFGHSISLYMFYFILDTKEKNKIMITRLPQYRLFYDNILLLFFFLFCFVTNNDKFISFHHFTDKSLQNLL